MRNYPLVQPPSWTTTPCRLSATAYSIYSQLPSISGGRPLHPQPEDALCRGDRDPHNMKHCPIAAHNYCHFSSTVHKICSSYSVVKETAVFIIESLTGSINLVWKPWGSWRIAICQGCSFRGKQTSDCWRDGQSANLSNYML